MKKFKYNIENIYNFITCRKKYARHENILAPSLMAKVLKNDKLSKFGNKLIDILPLSSTLNEKIKQQIYKRILLYLHSKPVIENEEILLDVNIQNELKKIKDRMGLIKYRPLISIIVPIYNVEIKWLKKCIFSVINQIYTNWELCICDDFSTDPEIRIILDHFAFLDSRIKIVYSKKNGNISTASNYALGIASGEYVSFLDHDDELMPNALYEVVNVINKTPDADFIYTDEAKLDYDGNICDPYLKPDWSPHHISSCMYILHMITIKKTLLDRIGWFRKEYDGCQDYDLTLRAVKLASRIVHIPKILYLWRKIEGSAADKADAKPYVFDRMKRLLQEQYPKHKIENGSFLGVHRLRPDITHAPKVTLVILTNDNMAKARTRSAPNILCNFVKSIAERTTYPNYEILIVFDDKITDITREYLKSYKYRAINYKEESEVFNFSKKVNFAVKHVTTNLFVLLNDDMEVINSGWLTALVEAIHLKDVGCAGAKLYYGNDTIQHAGMVGGVFNTIFHVFRKKDKDYVSKHNYTHIIRNYSSVTGACMILNKVYFEKIEGFDEVYATEYNDVDYCLRLYNDLGKYIVFTPYAELYHYENMSFKRVARLKNEKTLFHKRWEKFLKNDPFYNINIPVNEPNYDIDNSLLNKLCCTYFNKRKYKPIRIGYNGVQINGIDGTSRVSYNTFYNILESDRINDYTVYVERGQKIGGNSSKNEYVMKYIDRLSDVVSLENLNSDKPCIDIFHSVHPFHCPEGAIYTSLFALAPISIVQVLDLILFKNLTGDSPAGHKQVVDQLQMACSWADKITAISEFTKNDIVENLGVAPEKIEVIYLGIDKKFKRVDDSKRLLKIKNKYKVAERFMFYLGNHFPHKNLKNLVLAYIDLKKNTDLPHQLVLSGNIIDSGIEKEIIKLSKTNNLVRDIIFLGEIDEDDIVAFYNSADLCVYPSLYEGFGLPPLEAMACGIPVVASDKTSIPEILGDAACLTDATNVNLLAESIFSVCTNVQYRNRLIGKGFERVKRFTWENTAEKTIHLYHDLYGKYIDGMLFSKEKEIARRYFKSVEYFKENESF